MYRANEAQQMSIYDSYLKLPGHIQKLVEYIRKVLSAGQMERGFSH